MAEITMRLSYGEFFTNAMAGLLRFSTSVALDRNVGARSDRSWIERAVNDICGTLSEYAYMKYSGLCGIPEIDTFHSKPDCGSDVEIRSTTFANNPHLFLRGNDQKIANHRFIIAVVTGQEVRFIGWIVGSEGMIDQWRMEDGGSLTWKVPRHALRDMDTFDFLK